MAIVKSFELELKELLYEYNASIIFEYDKDYKFHNVRVVNNNNEVLFETLNTKDKIVINGNDLYLKPEEIMAGTKQVRTYKEWNKLLNSPFGKSVGINEF